MTKEQTFISTVLPLLNDSTLERAPSIQIVSGEGDLGTVEEYTGKRTVRALKARLTRERCKGDRWAFAQIAGYEV
jgi:hypothetical protein